MTSKSGIVATIAPTTAPFVPTFFPRITSPIAAPKTPWVILSIGDLLALKILGRPLVTSPPRKLPPYIFQRTILVIPQPQIGKQQLRSVDDHHPNDQLAGRPLAVVPKTRKDNDANQRLPNIVGEGQLTRVRKRPQDFLDQRPFKTVSAASLDMK